MIAHVGGRYADVKYAHDGRLERTVEVHSTWGTFEWLLHDAFDKGYRVGVVCHSDDHKGRPGATRPGASTFGAIGGLTCYLMPELTRDALFAALRARRHYGTTGNRIFVDLRGTFAADVTGFSEDPQLGPAQEHRIREALMGDIIRPGARPMRLAAEIIGTAPVERVDVFHGTKVVQTVRPYAAADLGRRLRVMWQGAEYRGRGREVLWQGALTIAGNRFSRFAPVNFLNPERKVRETAPGTALAWTSVTTGNLAGIDIWLEEARRGTLRLETNIVSGEVDLASARRRRRHTRRRRPRPRDQRLSPARGRLEPPREARPRRHLRRRRGPARLSQGDPSRRKSGLDQPDLSDRVRGPRNESRAPATRPISYRCQFMRKFGRPHDQGHVGGLGTEKVPNREYPPPNPEFAVPLVAPSP